MCPQDINAAYCADEAIQIAGTCAVALKEARADCADSEAGANQICSGLNTSTPARLCGVSRQCSHLTNTDETWRCLQTLTQ